MLTEQQCEKIEKGLTAQVEPRRVAAYLCLHMGLTLAEAAALRVGDIDFENGTVFVRHALGKVEDGATALLPCDTPRTLPMPPHVRRYLRRHRGLYGEGEEAFLMSGSKSAPSFYGIQNLLTSICRRQGVDRAVSATDLRNAFIRRCIETGMDLYSLCAYIGIRHPDILIRRFHPYFKADLEAVFATARFVADAGDGRREDGVSAPRRMNLLILGAGSQGPVVKEIAEALGVFHRIAFLDDDPNNRLAIGCLSDLYGLQDEYPMAIPSFGDGELRRRYMDILEREGYIVPTLIHPSATVSPSAVIGRSSVVESRCSISANAVVGRGALISNASVIGTGAQIGEFAHVDSATVAKDAAVAAFARIPAGMVIPGDPARRPTHLAG